MIDIECAKDIMREYIDGYDSNNPRIALKKAHIFRVTDFAEQIAINLKSNPQDAGMELADEDVRLATSRAQLRYVRSCHFQRSN